MTHSKYSRRAFLGGLGVSLSFLPLLEADDARGDTPSGPKRLILMAWPNGVLADHFWPQGGFPKADPANFTISADEQSVLKPLIPHQKDILIMGGMGYKNQTAGGGHASMPFMFTGVEGSPINGTISDGVPMSAGGPSVDIFIANEIAKKSSLPFHSLQLQCIRHDGNDRFCSFYGPAIGGVPNAPEPEADPVKLFSRLFGGGALDDGRMKKIRAQRASVLDYVGRNLEGFGKRLGTDDRQKVESHLQSVRQIERQLDAYGKACKRPAAPDGTIDYTRVQYTPLIPTVHKLQADMVVAAMACDMTRVASLLWSDSANGGYTFFWLGDEFVDGRDADDAGSGGPYRQHHEIAHHAGSSPAHTRRKNLVDQWFISQFAYILEAMKQVPEGEGTMLDNSAVLCANVFSDGGSHSFNDLPWVMAGSCGGYFKTGRYLRWVGGEEGEIVPTNGLLASLCNAMDAPVSTFGNPAYGAPRSVFRG